MCCRGLGKAWGFSDCVVCPESTGTNTTNTELRQTTKLYEAERCQAKLSLKHTISDVMHLFYPVVALSVMELL